MECWDGGENDKGLEEGALKGSLFMGHTYTPVVRGAAYIRTYVAGGILFRTFWLQMPSSAGIGF